MNQTEQKPTKALPLPVNPSMSPFFLSQAQGFNGICSDSVGVGIMTDVMHDNECSQVISNLQTASETTLSAKTLYSYDDSSNKNIWGVAPGIGKSTQNTVKVELGEVWVLDQETSLLKKIKSRGEAGTVSDWTTQYAKDDVGKTCSVQKAVKEAFYEVRYQPVIDQSANSEKYGYVVKSVVVDVVLQKELKLSGSDDFTYCTHDQAKSPAQGYKFTQKFGIKFLPVPSK